MGYNHQHKLTVFGRLGGLVLTTQPVLRANHLAAPRLVAAALTAVLLALVTGCSCSTREPRIGLPPIGKTLTLMPAAIDATGKVSAPDFDKRSILYNVMWGGRPMTEKGNPTLRFYAGEPNSPITGRPLLWEVKWADLREAWRKNCDADEVATLDGPAEGRALACDFGLKAKQLADVTLVEAVDDSGEQKLATSFATWQVSDDVVGASIQLLTDAEGIP
jgi:hypothetical protein